MNPGRELDALIAEKVMGWSNSKDPILVREYYNRDTGEQSIDIPILPHYSTDIAAAWVVVEKLGDIGWWQTIESDWVDLDKSWTCRLMPSESLHIESNVEARAETAPHAICLAALKAVGEL